MIGSLLLIALFLGLCALALFVLGIVAELLHSFR